MTSIRAIACMLVAVLVAVVPSGSAKKLQPAEDGMSLSGIFHAKLEALHAKHMSGEIGKDAAPVAPPTGKGKPPPPPASEDNEPCYQGGDDCSDYDSTFDPCTKYNCNRDERRCMPEPREAGTRCGLDGDYYFGECNSGPGFCVPVESEFGDFGICLGIPKIGIPCNDYDDCTKDDTCKVVITDDGLFRGQCMGKFDADATCDDYDDRCTTNDRCQLVKTSEGDVPVCRGDVTEGEVCNDYNECSIEDQCIAITPRFTFDSGARCRGTVATGQTCNDYNECTDKDQCTEVPDDYGDYGTFIVCRGQLAAGRTCNDYNDCTNEDECQKSDYSDYSVCRGTPAAGGTCNDYNDCTAPDACVLSSSGDYAFCEGTPTPGVTCNDYDECSSGDVCVTEDSSYGDYSYTFTFCRGEPVSGGSCNDYNDCTTSDTCVIGDSGDYAFCSGTPAEGGSCNDYNDCTTGETCVLGTSGDYSFCSDGTPTPGEPCNDYSDYTSGDVCVASDYGVFCQGEFTGRQAFSPAPVPV